jgi:hypothetical protein
MPKSYSINGNLTNTASSTAPLLNIVGGTTVRVKIYDLCMGSDATPADQATKYALQRSTTAGTTPTTAITPQALDAADPAAVAVGNQGTFAANPTLTANAFLLQWSQNQRATYRWVAAPGKELIVPATSANGIALLSLVTTAAYNAVYSFEIEE